MVVYFERTVFNRIHFIVFIALQQQALPGELPFDLLFERFIVAVIEYSGFHQILRCLGSFRVSGRSRFI